MTATGDEPRYKVGKVIQRYGLDGLGAELEARWLGENDESASLRELATDFNKAVLRSVVADSRQFGGDIDHLYARLTGEDVSRGEQTRLRKRLERDGIDIEQVEADFVTHQAIHTYLTEGRNVRRDTEPDDPVASGRETIDRLRGRLVAVSETTLSTLRDGGAITLGSFDVLTEVTVHCTDCETHKPIRELLADRGCDCPES